MLKVLINSYTCCPNMGSEQGMGWNFITYLAKHCELYVISEGEYKEQCEGASRDLPIHWYWNPVPQSTRDKCWNQGNWSFYPLYKKWQEKTADMAREIILRQAQEPGGGIDILHQLNMIGFREPGCLAKVSKETGIPLVWGPIGGLKMFPMAYASGLKMKAFNWLKNTITEWQIRHDKRVVETLHLASALVSSIPDSYQAIKRCHGLESVIIPETGCFLSSSVPDREDGTNCNRFQDKTLHVMWVGKFDFRKRLDIALKAVIRAEQLLHEIHCQKEETRMHSDVPFIKLSIYGTGSAKQIEELKRYKDYICFDIKGARPNDEVKRQMRQSDLFLFTSVNEDTSTVVLEAVSNQLPVLCFDACGMAAVIDETVGHKVPLTTPEQSVKDFADWLVYAYQHRYALVERSEDCLARREELSWENKAKKMVEIYEGVVKELQN